MAKKLIREIGPGNFLNTTPEALSARKRHWDTAPNPEDFFREIRRPEEALHAKGGMVKGGSYTVPAMCGGGKVIKSWGR